MNNIFGAEPAFDEKLLKVLAEVDAFEGYAHPHGIRIAAIADALANISMSDRTTVFRSNKPHSFTISARCR